MKNLISFLLLSFLMTIGFSQKSLYDQAKEEEDKNKKINLITESIEKEGATNWKYYSRAWAYMGLRKYGQAIRDFNTSLNTKEGNLDDFYNYTGMGWAYYDLEDYSKALLYANKALEIRNDRSGVWYLRGWTYIKTEKWEKAAADLTNYIKYKPESATGYGDRAYCYQKLNQWQKVLDDCNAGLKIKPNDEKLMEKKSTALIKLGREKDALAVLGENADFDHKDPASYLDVGFIFYNNRDYETAITYFDKGISIYEKLIAEDREFIETHKSAIYDIYMARGDAYEKLDEHQHALQSFQKATEIDPKNPRAWTEMGESHTFHDNYQQAINNYERAFTLDPDQITGWVNLGYCYDRLGQNKRAISAYTRGIKADPTNGLLYNNRGYAYLEIDEKDKALADIKKAVEVQPEIVMSHVSLGEWYLEEDNYDEAIPHFSQAIGMTNGTTKSYLAAYYYRGKAYMGKEQYDKAIKDFYSALEYKQNDVMSWEKIGICHFELEENCKAYTALRHALDLDHGKHESVTKDAVKYLGKIGGNPCK